MRRPAAAIAKILGRDNPDLLRQILRESETDQLSDEQFIAKRYAARHCVYVFRGAELYQEREIYKIGRSRDASVRLRQIRFVLRFTTWEQIHEIGCHMTAVDVLEAALHSLCMSSQVLRELSVELFTLSQSDLDFILSLKLIDGIALNTQLFNNNPRH